MLPLLRSPKLGVGELGLHTDGVGETSDDTGRSPEHTDGGVDAGHHPHHPATRRDRNGRAHPLGLGMMIHGP